MPPAPCPCGRLDSQRQPLQLAQCCGRYLEHAELAAPDAESLMRSRYSAYVLQRPAYLLMTWHSSTRPSSMAFESGIKWLGLEVRRHRYLDDAHAQVEFVARSSLAGRAVRQHELSQFVREGGHWTYLSGQMV